MYEFIEKVKEEYLISDEDIRNIEDTLKIKFPVVLRDYYLHYNGAEIKEIVFYTDDFEHEVSCVLPLKHRNDCIERMIEIDRKNGYIPDNMIPIASDDGGDLFYWDTLTENVYAYYDDNIENPIYICSGIKAFFDIMNENIYEE